jgi:capsular exopolysaccharide synthesis family protein
MNDSQLTLPVENLPAEVARPTARRAVHDPITAQSERAFGDDAPRALRDYVMVLVKHRRLAAWCFAGTLALTMIVTLVMPRRYTATTSIYLFQQPPIRLQLEHSVVGRNGDGSTVDRATVVIATQVAALKSNDVAARVIRRFDLENDRTFLGRRPPRDPDARRAFTLERYRKGLSVRAVAGTDLVEVGFTTGSAALAAQLAAGHVDAYVDAAEDVRRSTDRVAGSFLRDQTRDARRKMHRADRALKRFAARHPEVSLAQDYGVDGQQVTQLAVALAQAEATHLKLRSHHRLLTRPGVDPVSHLLDRSGVQKLRLGMADLRAERASLGGRLGTNHPRMTEIGRLEVEMKRQLDGEVKAGIASVQARMEAARAREDALRRKLSLHQEGNATDGGLVARYAALRSRADAVRELHASLEKRRMASAVDAGLVTPQLAVVERAAVPRRPSSPKAAVNLAFGLAAGLVLALAAAFGRNEFDRTVRSTEEVEDLLRLRSLATIPDFALVRPPSMFTAPPRQEAGGEAAAVEPVVVPPPSDVVVLQEPWSGVTEAFRSLRTALVFGDRQPPPRVIVLTSARAAEGKTMTSANLACALAEGGARVVLVDADLRHPRCHTLLGIDRVPGLSDVLGRTAPLTAALRAAGPRGLWVLPAGRFPSNPVGLLGSERAATLIERLRRRFDFVIVDTPPALSVTDAALLARRADGVLLVLRGQVTPRDLALRAQARLEQAGAHFLGVVVNMVGRGWGDSYFYESYYPYTATTERRPIEPAVGARFRIVLERARDLAQRASAAVQRRGAA